jgi:hypothetical protein
MHASDRRTFSLEQRAMQPTTVLQRPDTCLYLYVTYVSTVLSISCQLSKGAIIATYSIIDKHGIDDLSAFCCLGSNL